MSSPSTAPKASSTVLYRHSRRPDWGVAMVAWREADRSGLMFEDGKCRVVAQPFYKLLERVEPDDGERVVAELKRLLRAEGMTPASVAPAGPAVRADTRPSVAEQLMLFRNLYAEDFQSESYLGNVRGVDAPRSLKRHLNHALNVAAENLAAEDLKKRLAVGDLGGIFDAMAKTMSGTSMVPPASRKRLEGLDSETKADLARAFVTLVEVPEEDGEALSSALEDWFNTLARTGIQDWKAATCLLSIVAPNRHVYVDPAAIAKQMTALGRRKFARRLTLGSYLRALDLVHEVKQELEEAEAKPHDLLDVTFFIREVNRPAVKNQSIPLAGSTSSDESEEE